MASISLSFLIIFIISLLYQPSASAFHLSDNAPHATYSRRRMRFMSAEIQFKPCRTSDIAITQAAGSPLPNGIPTYSVQICSTCSSRCPIWNVHVSCGLFASVKIVNPRVFRRVGPDDCIVNDGKPLESGVSLSFVYANSFSYPMEVSRANIC